MAFESIPAFMTPAQLAELVGEHEGSSAGESEKAGSPRTR